jgi:succinoglycan biosynthesis transport protein ExoP
MFEAPRQIRSAVAGTDNFAVGFAPLSQIDLSKIPAALWRGRATIVYTTIAALALAVLFVVLSPHEYTAVTQILIDPSDLRAVGTDTTQASQMSDAALMQAAQEPRSRR